jgi:hypothetical protein
MVDRWKILSANDIKTNCPVRQITASTVARGYIEIVAARVEGPNTVSVVATH